MNIRTGLLPVFLGVGVIIGLALNPYVETPSSPAVEETKTTTTTITTKTTITETSTHFPYSIAFQKRGCGPNGWGYDFHIMRNGSAIVDSGEGMGSFDYSIRSSARSVVHTDLILKKWDFDEINSLLLSASIFSLNDSYPWKGYVFDVCYNKITVFTNEEIKTVEWRDKAGADISTPEMLFEIGRFFSNKLPSEHRG